MHLYMGEWLMYLYMRERRVHSVRHEYGWVKSQMWCVSQMWVSHVSEMWVRHASAMWVSHVYSGWYLTVGDIFAIADDITHCEMRVRHVSVMWVSHVYRGWYPSLMWVRHVYSEWVMYTVGGILMRRLRSQMWESRRTCEWGPHSLFAVWMWGGDVACVRDIADVSESYLQWVYSESCRWDSLYGMSLLWGTHRHDSL